MGVILGTAAYMSPEQAKGRPADKRADVWAFGCVLYEMLTGRAPFAGDDVSDTLANVLKREPDWTALPADVPPAIRALLTRCLEKDRRRRVSDIAAALFAIDQAASLGAARIPTAAVVRPSLMQRAVVPFAALVLGAALVAAIVSFRPAPAEAPEMRLQVVTPPPGGEAGAVSFAISPDGQSLVFRAVAEQTTQLWLYRVAASGGQRPAEATRIEAPGQAAHRFPHFLPDGRRFLFFATGTPDVQGVFVGTLDSLEATRLVDADTAAVFVPPDWVLFGREESLYAQRVDPRVLVPVGEPLLVADGVAQDPGSFASVALSATASGLFAHRVPAENARELVWYQREGTHTGTLGAPSGLRAAPSLSPDGRTVAVGRTVDGNTDIWLIEAARGVLRRFTFDAASDSSPVWSPDGSRIAFHSSRKGGGLNDLYQKSLSGGAEEVLLETSENKNVSDWSPDGRFILYANQSPKTARDIWALPLDGDRKPFIVVQTGFGEVGAGFSPDGRWIAYVSNETGRDEVFVQPFPGPGRNWQVSTNGGNWFQWRGDGREIFYLAPDNRLMAVPVRLDASTPAVDAGIPVALFPVRPGAFYAATPDGQRFLINTPTDAATASPITVVLNWKAPAP